MKLHLDPKWLTIADVIEPVPKPSLAYLIRVIECAKLDFCELVSKRQENELTCAQLVRMDDLHSFILQTSKLIKSKYSTKSKGIAT